MIIFTSFWELLPEVEIMIGKVWEAIKELKGAGWKAINIPKFVDETNEAKIATSLPHDLGTPFVPLRPPCLSQSDPAPIIVSPHLETALLWSWEDLSASSDDYECQAQDSSVFDIGLLMRSSMPALSHGRLSWCKEYT